MTLINVVTNFTSARSPEQYRVTADTTAGDLVAQVLARHRMLSKDPRLLYVTLETGLVSVTGSSSGRHHQQHHHQTVRESTELPNDARLLEQTRLHRQRQATSGGGGGVSSRHQQQQQQHLLFVMHMRPGGLLKIHDSCIMPSSFYNSLYVSTVTSAQEVIQLLLASYGSPEPAANFCLVAVVKAGSNRGGTRRLGDTECPLVVQQMSGRQATSIHLKRVTDSGVSDHVVQEQQPQQQQQHQKSSSETLARLQSSFRDLQRLRRQDPARYDELLVASGPADEAAVETKTSTAAVPTGFQSARDPGGMTDRDRLQFRYSVRRLPSHNRKATDGGCQSARSPPVVRTATAREDELLAAPVNGAGNNNVKNGSFHRDIWANRSYRGGEEQRASAHHLQLGQSKRQLPQLPAASAAMAEAADSRRQQHPTTRDFQCQAAFEDDNEKEKRAAKEKTTPSLREIFAACDVSACQLVRQSSYLDGGAWGIRWQEVQFDCTGGDLHRKPAIGSRQGGAFRRNERLLRRMRTLVAVQSIESNGAAASTGELQPGDLIVEINGRLATSLSPDEVDKLASESQLTLDLLVARQPLASSEEEEASMEQLEDDSGEEAQNLRSRLRRLQQQYNELAGRYRAGEQLAQRLQTQLSKMTRVKTAVLVRQDRGVEQRIESAERAAASFRVIDAAAVV